MNNKEPKVYYKGFDSNLKCRDFQYKVGSSYSTKGATLCSEGFHACMNISDVLNYYPITSRFCEVSLSGDVVTEKDKSCSTGITILKEITLKQVVEQMFVESNLKIKQASSEDYSQQASSGYGSKQASSGYSSKQASSGDYNQQTSSGYKSKQASSGEYSQQASSGDYSRQASSGYGSKQASSGDHSQQASSGDHSKLACLGIDSEVACQDCSFIVCESLGSRIKGGKNSTLVFIIENKQTDRYEVVVGYPGKGGLKEDTWYCLDSNNNFLEANTRS